MTDRDHLRAWLTLHLVPGLGPVTCNKLVAYFGSPEAVTAASTSALAEVVPLRRETRDILSGEGRVRLETLVARELKEAERMGIALVPCDDPLYPPLLKQIHDPPMVLYVLGNPRVLDCRSIGIVGSRAATRYGLGIAAQMSNSLASQGFTIVSGMALGIDTAAHNGALAAGGRTIAVLGCGLDIVYPPGNRDLHRKITAAGAVVSEFPLGTKPDSFRFPARNRIISGLSLGVLVVEAANRSGSLITADHALEQGREVFAVPGRIDSMKSAGTHTLLQQGAKLVHSINDIIEELSGTTSGQDHEKPGSVEVTEELIQELSLDEAKLFNCLDVYPRTIDEIVLESGFTAQRTNELLLHLELKGLVEPLPGTSYRKLADVTVG